MIRFVNCQVYVSCCGWSSLRSRGPEFYFIHHFSCAAQKKRSFSLLFCTFLRFKGLQRLHSKFRQSALTIITSIGIIILSPLHSQIAINYDCAEDMHSRDLQLSNANHRIWITTVV